MVCACIAAIQLLGIDDVLLARLSTPKLQLFFLPGSQQGLASPDRASVILLDYRYENTEEAAMIDRLF